MAFEPFQKISVQQTEVKLNMKRRMLASAALLLLRCVIAPVPCLQEYEITLIVGGKRGRISFSQTHEHGEFEERMCSIINDQYEGMILLGCDEGETNGTVDDCVPRHCPVYSSVSVGVGEKALAITPFNRIEHGGHEVRLCREINPTYKNLWILYCNYGELSYDVSKCDSQWHQMEGPPWISRSQHSALTLSDGAILMFGGLADSGPLNDVWEWKPDASLDKLIGGRWMQPPIKAPWTPRFGVAATWQAHPEAGEVVTLLGGNDGLNRNDVWRWLRLPTRVEFKLKDSDPTGTEPKDCVLNTATETTPDLLTCKPGNGVQGRRWYIPYELQPSTAVFLDLRYNRTGPGGVAIVALQLDECRHVFEVRDGQWTSRGCTYEQPLTPPWITGAEEARIGGDDLSEQGRWHALHLEIDREYQRLRFFVDGAELLPADGYPIFVGPSVMCARLRFTSKVQDSDNNSFLSEDEESCMINSRAAGQLITEMEIKTIESASWPNATIEIKHLGLRAPPGHWQRVAEDPPWLGRSSHAAVALPEGDLLMAGGIEASGPLNDVWRWMPLRCSMLSKLGPEDASLYELECGIPCTASEPYGQWKRLENAPWAPRQGHQMIWTSIGVLLIGGRTAEGFKNDVWRWQYYGSFCSVEWQGKWIRLIAAAAFEPRYGHRLVGFATSDERQGVANILAADTLLLYAGFGGDPIPLDVVLPEQLGHAIVARSDVWCSTAGKHKFIEWTQLAPDGPFNPRMHTATVISPTLGDWRVMLFGGYDKAARQTRDQWRWTGENTTSECKIEQLDDEATLSSWSKMAHLTEVL